MYVLYGTILEWRPQQKCNHIQEIIKYSCDMNILGFGLSLTSMAKFCELVMVVR